MTLKTLIIALAAFAAFPCAAVESVEVRQAYVEKVREVSEVLAIAWLCGHAGYTFAPDIVPKTVEPVVFQAEKEGMSFSDATDILSVANTAANKAEIASTNDYIHSRDTKAWFAHVDGKCGVYATLPAYAPYLKSPADPTASYAKFSAWAASQITAS